MLPLLVSFKIPLWRTDLYSEVGLAGLGELPLPFSSDDGSD